MDASAGVPPDAFSKTGQDWGLPVYRWNVVAERDFSWLRERARRNAVLFDGYRVDHLVGLYRTFGRPRDGAPFFNPADEGDQILQGERILQILMQSGATIVAEDLGVVPDFVRASLERLGVPGSKVLRWERAWHVPGQPFVDPAAYPARSAAMTGTHDTTTLAGWWDEAPQDERAAVAAMLASAGAPGLDPDAGWNDRLRDALLTSIYRAGSQELFLPIQDIFGWRDRINTPATVTDQNWTFRLPWPADRIAGATEATERAAFCRAQASAAGRGRRADWASDVW
jgi:4-alpha-glucanotransferase